MVQVEHESVGALHESVRRVLVLLEEGKLVDNIGNQAFPVVLFCCVSIRPFKSLEPPIIKLIYLESTNLLLNVILQLTKSRSVSSVQRPQLALKDRLVQNLANTDTPAGSLVTVARTNSLPGGADLATTQLRLLQTINNRVQIEADMRAVGDEYAFAGILQPLLFQRGQLLEEAGDVHDSSSANEVDTGRRHQSRGKNVEVISDVLMDDGVARIW